MTLPTFPFYSHHAANGPASARADVVWIVDPDTTSNRRNCEVLETVGYSAVGFANPPTASTAPNPACVIIALGPTGQSEFEFVEQLQQLSPATRAVFVVSGPRVEQAVEAMHRGAVDVLTRPIDNKRMLTAVSRAVREVHRDVTRQRELEAGDALLQSLTDKERETLDLLLSGAANKEMASRLGISQRAVEMRRASLMKKFGCKTLAALFERAITHRVQKRLFAQQSR